MTPPYDPPPSASPQREPAPADPLALKRSGSERRRRNHKTDTRWDDDEYAILLTKSQDAGLSPNGYIRALVTGTPGPRARRRPPVHVQALGLATAALNKLGSNFNQIAHRLNAGGAFSLAGPYTAALADIRATLHAIREAAAGRAADCHDHQGQPPR